MRHVKDMLPEDAHEARRDPMRNQPCRHDRSKFEQKSGRKDAGENGREQGLPRSHQMPQIESTVHLTTSP
jgi:hypothetical protein